MKKSLAWVSLIAAAMGCGEEPGPVFPTSLSSVVAAGTDATFIVHNVPGAMSPGETRSVQIEVQNSGSVDWNNNDYLLRSPTVGGFVWSAQRISAPVAANGTVIFTRSVTAPSTEGLYSFNARMYLGRRTGGGFFGATLSVPVQVDASIPSEFDASLISHTVPSILAPGERRDVDFVLVNTGSRTWDPSDVELRPRGSVAGTRSRPLAPVAEQQQVTLSVSLTAPTTSGPATYVARMSYWDGFQHVGFGETISVSLTVDSTPPAANAEPETELPALGPIDDGTAFTVDGQSNGITFNASPALSTATHGGNRRADGATFSPLFESTVEGPLSGFLNTMRSLCGGGRDFIGSEHACTSCGYSDIADGSVQYFEWKNQLSSSSAARGASPYRCKGSLLVHGETNEAQGTASSYAADIHALRLAKEADCRAITGQEESFDMFLGMQLGSHVELTGKDFAPCITCLQTMELMTAIDLRRFWVVGPGYNYAYQSSGNDVHLTNAASRQMGSRAGYVACEVYGNGVDWRPLMITEATQSGNTLTLDYHNPTSTMLSFDTTLVAPRELPGKGFTLVCDDRLDNPTVLGDPTVIDANTVSISLTQPADEGCSIAYAYNNGREDVGAVDATAPGGNLRDSNPLQANGENLYNWAATQKVAISGAAARASPGGAVTAQRSHTFAWDFEDCRPSPEWSWINPYKESANMESPHPDALTPLQLLLDATDTAYTCNVSTGALEPAAIGASRVNKAISVAGGGCFRDATGLHAVPHLPDATDALLTAIFEIDGATNTQSILMWNSGAREYITLQTAGTTVTTRWRSAEGAAISRSFTGVAPNVFHLFQAHYRGECRGPGTNPCVDIYLDGAKSAGVSHSVNFGRIDQPITGVGLLCDQAGGSNFSGSVVWGSLDFGSDMSWFMGEATHDADWSALCPAPPCGA